MRTKDDILTSEYRNSKNTTGPVGISLIHSLLTLEVLIDIRDILDNRLLEIDRDIDKILSNRKQ